MKRGAEGLARSEASFRSFPLSFSGDVSGALAVTVTEFELDDEIRAAASCFDPCAARA